MKIKALLLAAGFGTRLRPLTLTNPKCLMKINGEPILGHWLKKLDNLGCNEVLINTHYLNKKVEDYISKNNFKNMKVSTFYEKSLLGTAGTLLENLDFFQDSVGLLIHADNYTDDSLNDFISRHIRKPEDCLLTMLTFKTDDPSSCGIVEKDRLGKIINFHEKTREYKGNCANGALYAFNNDFLDYLRNLKIKPSDFSTEVIPKILGKIFSYQTNSVYLDIGNPSSYEKANAIAKERKIKSF